mmetsp:Transcript_115183/g.215699  ORF Transcript_115183/g.215699 Transcript_115183/m.215699 type:complete len:568 (+) Transcript_115183:155-1858(+)
MEMGTSDKLPAEAGAASTVHKDCMHIVSWNVAGWKKTVEQIRKFPGGIPAFLERHHIDVICLQETKLTAKTITDEAKVLGANIPGYESFWACNEGAGVQRQGLNGVATIGRRGLVLRADSAPLGDPELDGEGRCLMTDLGDFVLFNVYVPNSAEGTRLPFKLRWLRALRAAMQRARSGPQGRPVVLAGDLNMKHRAMDCFWSGRSVSLTALSQLANSAPDPEIERAAATLCAEWPAIRKALCHGRENRQFETKNSRTGVTFQRWGVFVQNKQGDQVRLGEPFTFESCAVTSYIPDGIGCEEDGTLVLGLGSQDAANTFTRPSTMALCDLVECLKKIAGVEIGQRVLKSISESIGGSMSAPPVREWLQSVLQEDGMVDSFAELYPAAEERFTCWDQYRNRRYQNVGSRIDYILVDQRLLERVQRGLDLDVGNSQFGPNDAAASLAAATLGGLSKPSPFEGGGMQTLEEDEYFAQFRGGPATGMVYTPPQLSDHVGVSLCLRTTAAESQRPGGGHVPRSGGRSPVRDASTRRCQPHRAGKRITDFFGKKRAAEVEPIGGLDKRKALGAA